MDVYRCVRTLRAVRSFRPDALSREAIEHILQAGRWRGSSKNTPPWQFVVVQERATLETLSRCGAYAGHLAGAACGIGIAGEPGAGSFDRGRCAQNMMLAAWNEGIGSCIASLHDEGTARGVLGGVPADHNVRTAISFGYPAPPDDLIQGRPRTSVLPRLGRRPLHDLVHWEQWTARA